MLVGAASVPRIEYGYLFSFASWLAMIDLLQSKLVHCRSGSFMKIADTVTLISRGAFAQSDEWQEIRASILAAIIQAEWPPGSGSFTIYPECGKKSGQGNGVVPIKDKPMEVLRSDGWMLEWPWDFTTGTGRTNKKGVKPGDIDAAKQFEHGLVVVEWETGNISSSHRAINKIALGLLLKTCIAGVLVVPNKRLTQYLTDRVGNVEELQPYYPLWRSLNLEEGVLELVVIEQDADSTDVPRIPKANDGRAKEGALAVALKNMRA